MTASPVDGLLSTNIYVGASESLRRNNRCLQAKPGDLNIPCTLQ